MRSPAAVVAVVVVVVVCVVGGGATCRGPVTRRPPTVIVPDPWVMPDAAVCDGDYGAAVDVVLVGDAVLREISGLAQSVQNHDVMWAIADAGNAAAVYGVSSSTGETRLTVVLPVDNVDFEDVAVGPCPDASGPCVYVGDTGDNDTDRDHVVVYAFPEPVVADDAPAGSTALDAVWALPMAFPNGASINVEGFVVAKDASAIVLFEKTATGDARIFAERAPWGLAVDDEAAPVELERTGTVPSSLLGDLVAADDNVITGAAAHWSGRRLLLRTPTHIVEFDVDGPAGLLDLSTATVRALLPSPSGEGARGEAVSYDDSGAAVISVAEGDADRAPVLHRSGCP